MGDVLVQHRRVRDERGATLIEAAIITPVLMLFVFGIFEFGFAFRDYLTVANIARDAAREASVAGDALNADYRVLRAVDRASAALPDGAIDRIVVYETNSAEGLPTAGCMAGTSSSTVGSRCNVYTTTELKYPETEFDCNPIANPIPAPDRFYCPDDRDVVVGNLDYVGIWVQVSHQYITGLFGTSIVFDDQIVLKVEPQDTT